MQIDIKEFLSSFKGADVDYVPNPGNAGDALIAAATYQLFDNVGLSYNMINRRKDLCKNRVVFYGGGGNLGLMKNFSARFLSKIYSGVERLVILPHTIKSIDPLLAVFQSNVDIICREQVSFDYVSRSGTKANVYLSDDLALWLNTDVLLKYNPAFSKKLNIAKQYFLAKSQISSEQAPSFSALEKIFTVSKILKFMNEVSHSDFRTLQAFRTDSEKTQIALPTNNLDVSDLLEMGVENKELAYMNAHYFLSFLNQFEIVRTNRLHVAIGATLLGKNVEFYDNSYYKCKAVYDYSLKKFDNIEYKGLQ